MSRTKILIIRFSSFGDIVQSLSLPSKLHEVFPGAEIHWLTRTDFREIAEAGVTKAQVWTFDRNLGLGSLLRLALKLRQEQFTHIYDAHYSMRSRIVSSLLMLTPTLPWLAEAKAQFVKRPRYRWRRFLLFQFHINKYPRPFTGQFSLLEALQKWGASSQPPPAPQLLIPQSISELAAQRITQERPDWLTPGAAPLIALSPSASYDLKRWPEDYWRDLILLRPECNFVLLGGPEDRFIERIVQVAPTRTLNLAGKLSYLQSAAVVALSKTLISNDTGLMHIAEQLGKTCIALMGPAPFGFPCRNTTHILEVDLKCRPCSKHGQGPCRNKVYQKCLVDIHPQQVSNLLTQRIKGL